MFQTQTSILYIKACFLYFIDYFQHNNKYFKNPNKFILYQKCLNPKEWYDLPQ